MTKKRPPYEKLLQKVLKKGNEKGDRTGTGTVSLFGQQIRYDLSKGFPLITTKRVPMSLIVSELLFFLKGSSLLADLLADNNHIWSEWPFVKYLEATGQKVPAVNSEEWVAALKAYEERVMTEPDFGAQYGDLGPIYGVQWVDWPTPDGGTINQVRKVVETIKVNPNSRRLVVSAWNPADLEKMVLEPCHILFQFYVNDGKLSCQMYQRSADMFLGVPFNIASYALLTHMVAQQCDLEVGEFIWVGGDTHIYNNHAEQVKLQLTREARPLPELVIKRKPDSIFDYTIDDFALDGYDPHPGIKGAVAV